MPSLLPYLSCSGPMAHKASVILLQFILSLATYFASVCLPPQSYLSFFNVFGQPTFSFPSGVHVKVVMQCLSPFFLSFFLSTSYPNPSSALYLYMLIFFNLVLFKISLSDTTYDHLAFWIFLRHLTKNESCLQLPHRLHSITVPAFTP